MNVLPSKTGSARAPLTPLLERARVLGSLLALHPILGGCSAADRVGEAADEVEQALQRVECVEDDQGLCPPAEFAWQLLELAIDDCYDVVSIDSGPDTSCCFGITVDISVYAAVDCL